MEVVKSNFDFALPDIIGAIQSADMISIDMELTGIGGAGDIKLLPVDTPAQRYSKYRASAESYKPNQFGICTFKWDAETDSSSLSFLAGHDFDFNKWIKEGISYLSLEQEQAIRKDLSNQKVRNQESVVLAPADEVYVNDLLAQVKNWVDMPTNGEPKAPLNLPPVSSYHRRLTYQEVSRVYPDLYLKTEQDPTEGSRFISVQVMTEEQRAQREEEKRLQQEEELRVAIGFRHVIDALIDAKKPIVGHNCFLDVLHLYHQFVADLPLSYDDFKAHVHDLFPKVFDTKQILHELPDVQTQLGSTVLGEIFSKMKKLFVDPPVWFSQGYDRYDTATGFHEAGFDAYATGMCFFGICDMIAKKQENGVTHYPIFANHRMIGDYVNRLHLMKIRGYMKLGGPDVAPSRESLVWISGLTAEVRSSDLQRHFSNCGKCRIHWIDDAQCILEFFGGERKLSVTPEWIQTIGLDAPFNIRAVADYDALQDQETQMNQDVGPPSPGKFNRKRKRENGDQNEQEAKKRRLSLGGINCLIS